MNELQRNEFRKFNRKKIRNEMFQGIYKNHIQQENLSDDSDSDYDHDLKQPPTLNSMQVVSQ